MRQWCLLVKRRSRGLRLRRTHSLHWIVRVCSRLVHEVVEVTKLLGSLYLCGCFLRERCDACNLQHHGVRQWCPSQVSNSRIVFSVWKSRMMQDETRHCAMMQDGVAELLSFLLPSFVKLVFCWCVQPSVCRSLRQWFFAMSNSWVAFSVLLWTCPWWLFCAQSEHSYSHMYAECSWNKWWSERMVFDNENDLMLVSQCGWCIYI